MTVFDAVSQAMERFVEWVQAFGLWAVFILAAADSFGLPATGDVAMLIWAGLRQHPLALVMVVGFAGAMVGDSAAYWAGRLLGARLVRRLISAQRQQSSTQYIHRHAAKALVGSRLLAAVRTKVVVLAGASHFPYPRFLLWNALGCALWAVVYGTIGRIVGDAVGVTGVLDQIGIVALIGISLTVLLVLAQRLALPWWTKRRVNSDE